MQETQKTWVQSLDLEDDLKKGMAIIPAFLAWKSYGQRSLEGYSPWGWIGGTVAEVQILWPLDGKWSGALIPAGEIVSKLAKNN